MRLSHPAVSVACVFGVFWTELLTCEGKKYNHLLLLQRKGLLPFLAVDVQDSSPE